jgi:hypothetical protein
VQAKAMTPATTATQRTTEMPETVLTATTCEFMKHKEENYVENVRLKKLKLIFNLYCFPFHGIKSFYCTVCIAYHHTTQQYPFSSPRPLQPAPPFCDASRTANRQPESVKVSPMGDSHIDSANIERGHFIRVAK